MSVAKSGGAVLCTGHIQEPASGTESSNLTRRQSDSHPLSYTQSPLRLPFSTTITPRDAPKPSHGCGCRPVSVVSRDRTYRRSIALKWIQLRQATCLRRVTVSPFTSDRAWSRLCAANFPSRTRPPRVKAPYRLCALAVRMRRWDFATSQRRCEPQDRAQIGAVNLQSEIPATDRLCRACPHAKFWKASWTA